MLQKIYQNEKFRCDVIDTFSMPKNDEVNEDVMTQRSKFII